MQDPIIYLLFYFHPFCYDFYGGLLSLKRAFFRPIFQRSDQCKSYSKYVLIDLYKSIRIICVDNNMIKFIDGRIRKLLGTGKCPSVCSIKKANIPRVSSFGRNKLSSSYITSIRIHSFSN